MSVPDYAVIVLFAVGGIALASVLWGLTDDDAGCALAVFGSVLLAVAVVLWIVGPQ